MVPKFAIARICLTSIALIGVASAVPALADVDRTPAPGGVFRLKPGIYVANGSSCADAPNAAIREYDGKGISTPHTRACRVRILSRKGQTYRVEQSCLDAGAGPAKRFSQRQTVFIDNAIAFRQTISGQGTNYQYCPVYQLPKELRKPAYYPGAQRQ